MKLRNFLGFITKRAKRCPHCGIIKPVSEFHKNRSNKDGLADECKTCSKFFKEQYKERCKEKILADARCQDSTLFPGLYTTAETLAKPKFLAEYDDKELIKELEKRGYIKID